MKCKNKSERSGMMYRNLRDASDASDRSREIFLKIFPTANYAVQKFSTRIDTWMKARISVTKAKRDKRSTISMATVDNEIGYFSSYFKKIPIDAF